MAISASGSTVVARLNKRPGIAVPPSASYTPDASILALSPVAWWDASSLALNDGDLVSSWLDYSGNGRHGASSGTNRPTYKTGIQNGKPAVRIDTAQWLTYTTAALPDFTVFVAHSVSASTINFGGPFSWRAAGQAGFVLTNYSGGAGDYAPNISLWNGSSETGQRRKTTAVAGAVPFKVYAWTYSAGTPLLYENTVAAAMQAGVSGWSTQARIGQGYSSSSSSTNFVGDIAEIIVFSSTLNGTNRGIVESYLMTKYGL